MSILDLVQNAALKLLGETAANVDARREELAEQAIKDSVRRTREIQLSNPGLASTPYPSAIARQQQTIYKLQQAATKASTEAVTATLALEVAERTLAELEEAERRYHRQHGMKGDHPSGYQEWQDVVDALFARGVSKHTLKQLSKLEISFVADLLRWKKEDPRHLNEDSPWRAVFSCYASRTLQIVRGKDNIPLSSPGAPPPSKTHDTKYWHFDSVRGWSDGLPDRRQKNQTAAKRSDAVIREHDDQDADHSWVIDDHHDAIASTADELAERIEAAAEAVATRESTWNIAASSNPEHVAVDAALDLQPPRSLAELDEETIIRISEAFFDSEAGIGASYWTGTGLPIGTFEKHLLVPALERAIASGKNADHADEFLAAARRGEARQFYEEMRQSMALHYAYLVRSHDAQIIDQMKVAQLIR